jgi:hypothetical protein
MQPRKTSTRITCEGGSDPRRLLGGSSAKKWDALARFDLFRAVTFAEVVVANTLGWTALAEHRVKKLAILKVQRIILTVFTLFTFFFLRFHPESGAARGQDNEGNHVGLERPPRFPWQRSGVAPAQHGVLPVSKIHRRVVCNLCAPNNFEPRLSCAVHPSTPEETIKIRCHRHTSTIKEASKTEKRKRGFWPRATRICRKCFDGRESIESPLLTREHREGKKVEKNFCTSTFFRRVCQAMRRPEEGRPKAQQWSWSLGTGWMERDPRLEHTANSIRMADDFSEQDNLALRWAIFCPTPKWRPQRPAHERVVGRKPTALTTFIWGRAPACQAGGLDIWWTTAV